MAAKKLESEIDGLYALPLDKFTPARDALARQLRTDGDRDGAVEVKALRKPNLPAWALNRVCHREPGQIKDLLAAGAGLQEAQAQLVSGGERGLLRDAVAHERRLVDEVAALGERELTGSGHQINPALQTKLRATAHAAAVSPEAGELLGLGRLIRDYEVSDLGLMGGGAAVLPRAKRGSAKSDVAKREAAKPEAAMRGSAKSDAAKSEAAKRDAAGREAAERKALERQVRAAERELDRARSQHDKLAAKHHDAQRSATEARRQASKAAVALERAEATLEQADARARAAGAKVNELEASLQDLRC